MQRTDFKTFYPETPLLKEQFIAVGNSHDIYVAEYGNRNGIPVIYCHGGPGAGSKPQHARYFDPSKYYIILFDQRGAGQSTPKGCMENNTTQDLINDMEVIRNTLNIDRWVVGGGSWGSTLSLLYAESHPEQVLALILRGIFLARKKDTIAHIHDDSPAALINRHEWEKFKKDTAELTKADNITLPASDYIGIYYQLLQSANKDIRLRAAKTFSRWEIQNSALLDPAFEDIAWGESDDGINMGLTEVTYIHHNCYIKENQILDNIRRIENIPTHIIQGKYDLVCPPEQAYLLSEGLKQHHLYRTIAGHSGSEPETVHCMITAAETIAEHYNSCYSA